MVSDELMIHAANSWLEVRRPSPATRWVSYLHYCQDHRLAWEWFCGIPSDWEQKDYPPSSDGQLIRQYNKQLNK